MANLLKSKNGNWVIWDNPIYSGISLNLDFIYDYNKKLNDGRETEPPIPRTNEHDPTWKDPNFKDVNYVVIKDSEVIKK